MKTLRILLAGALLAVCLPFAAQAQVNVNVQVTVAQACSVSAPVDASFGTQTPLATTNLTATGSVTLTCNRGAAPLVAVGNGSYFNLTTRRMKDTGTNYIAYSIMQPTISGSDFTTCPGYGAGSAFGTVGDRLNASAAFSSSGGPRTVNLCFQTSINESTVLATYSDTVQVSVGF
jgi:spore coat protein U-like protein